MKLKSSILVLVVLMLISTMVIAAPVETKMQIVQKESEIVYLEKDQGSITKKIIDLDENTGDVTLQLKLTNRKKDGEDNKKVGTDIVFVMDNSGSMVETIAGGKSRKEVLINATTNFTEKLFTEVADLRIGVVKFFGATGNTSSTVLSGLTSNKSTILGTLNTLKNSDTQGGTNIDAGLTTAKSMLNDGTREKIMILFTDGVPTDAVGLNPADYTYGAGGKYTTSAEAQTAYNKDISTKTKATLQGIKKADISLLSIFAGMNDIMGTSKELMTDTFGTTANPTAGKLYNIQDSQIEDVIINTIHTEIMEKVQNPITTVEIKDYFPTEIIQNFDFQVLAEPSIGEVTKQIDANTKSIVWKIEDLKGNEEAILTYHLKIKDINNKELLDKVMATNEKVEITYQDKQGSQKTVTVDTSPSVKLVTIPQEEVPGDANSKDNTTAKGELPAAGEMNFVFLIVIAMIGLGSIIYSKVRKNKDI